MTGPETTVALAVDRDRCVCVGVCEATEPDVFEIGDDGVSALIGTGRLPADRARAVVEGCPSGAISVVER